MISRWLLWTNVLMAGSAAGWVVVTLQFLGLSLDWRLIALGFSLAFAFYNRDRLDQDAWHTDAVTMPLRTDWVQKNARLLQPLVWAGFIIALILIVSRPLAALPLLAGLGFALSYTLRWMPYRGQRVGWKHLPGMKMPFVAILWTLTTVITPATVYHQLGNGDVWGVAFVVCCLIMMQILLNDLRDVHADHRSKTLSLPVIWGTQTARQIGYLLGFISFVFGVWLQAIPLGLTAIYSLLLIGLYRVEQDATWRFWIEIQGLIAGGIALIGY